MLEILVDLAARAKRYYRRLSRRLRLEVRREDDTTNGSWAKSLNIAGMLTIVCLLFIVTCLNKTGQMYVYFILMVIQPA